MTLCSPPGRPSPLIENNWFKCEVFVDSDPTPGCLFWDYSGSGCFDWLLICGPPEMMTYCCSCMIYHKCRFCCDELLSCWFVLWEHIMVQTELNITWGNTEKGCGTTDFCLIGFFWCLIVTQSWPLTIYLLWAIPSIFCLYVKDQWVYVWVDRLVEFSLSNHALKQQTHSFSFI